MSNGREMSGTFTIQLRKPIDSAKFVDAAAQAYSTTSAEAGQVEPPESQKESLTKACQALHEAVKRLNDLQANIFREHGEQIAKLSVEIARKILVQKIEKGDYELESIIEEALKNAPTRQDAVVHLNPDDLDQFQEAQKNDPSNTLAGIKFAADPKVGRAECILETPKGIVESSINGHLEQISEALKKVE